MSIAFWSVREKQIEDIKQPGHMSDWQWVRTWYMIEDYNEILIKIHQRVKNNGINLQEAFKLMDDNEDGQLTRE